MGIGTWGWGSSCGGIVTSWGWGQCPCPDFIPVTNVGDICGTPVRTCVDVRMRPDELASRARPANIPSRSDICEE
jgi:hypothetical protein